MSNITISIDDDLLKKAKKIAIDRDTSFNGLIREYVKELVLREEKFRRLQIKELDTLFTESTARVGDITWSREDLHER
jgi:predicted transcriptional regulator